MGKKMAGKGGEDLVIRVPPGTLIYDGEHHNLLADLDFIGKKIVICRGRARRAGELAFPVPGPTRCRGMPSRAPRGSSGCSSSS